MILGSALALLVGLSLGLLGGGGSLLTVPILVYILGFGAKQAIAMNLGVVGATSLVGAMGHWREGRVNVRVALVFGAAAMLGTYLGARLSVFFSGEEQLLFYSLVVLVAGYFMFRDRQPREADADERRRVSVGALGLILLEGLAVGVLTGLVGVGGGFLIVPALVLLARIPMKQAVGTSLLVIALKSATGFYGYLGQVEIAWVFMGVFTAIAIVGILAGTYLVGFVSHRALHKAFAILLLLMGAVILYANSGAFLT